jgi:hypothetical protein
MSEHIYISNIKNKHEKYLFIKKYVNDIVYKLHNPLIIDPNLQPNANIIYSLYSDGTVTRQKGGYVYGKRNVTDIMYEIIKPNTFFTFPLKGENEGDTYAILLYDDCIKVRNIMNDLLLQV